MSKLDAQLYPVLTTEADTSKEVCRDLEDKLQRVLPELKRALAEICLRQSAAESLQLKGQTLKSFLKRNEIT